MYKVGVLGAGTWGMAVARVLCNRHHSVMVWSALPQEIEYIQKNRTHPKLPELEIPDDMEFTTDIKEVCNSEYLVVAVPSIFMRSTMETAKDYIKDQILIDLAKGVEKDSLYTMSEIIRDVLGNQAKIVALSGPTHAEEVVRDMPSTIVSACDDLEVAEKVQNLFQDTCMRVYTNIDVRGVELCGALKNIIALAAGISHGLNYGDNTRAALITRGLSEMTRLGTTMGCLEQTFHGLAGIGDLIVTATSVHSRNFKCGTLIGHLRLQSIPVFFSVIGILSIGASVHTARVPQHGAASDGCHCSSETLQQPRHRGSLKRNASGKTGGKCGDRFHNCCKS